ncbi:MAG: hypothetical protein JO165_00060, partial [Candidatus Eremiobacteraeota bacterium]|nr:hypothetical protein [Candidatus Eremiobacteraeota bacterium]
MKPRLIFGLLVFAAAFTALLAPACASTPHAISHGGVSWGNTIVPKDEVVHGNVTVLFGDVRVDGQVDGNVTDWFGEIYTAPGAVITGQKNGISGDYTEAIAPWATTTGGDLAEQNYKTVMRLAYNIVIVLAFLIFPMRTRMALDRLEKHPGLSAAAGAFALVSVIPIAILLLISIVGWPLIPLEALALVGGVLIGQAALALLVGRRLFELVRPLTTPSPLAALIVGLVVLTAAELVPVLGGVVLALVWITGLGAAILAFF